MKKLKKQNLPVELGYKTGILVVISRSGETHAMYFDQDNDFQSLIDCLNIVAQYYESLGFDPNWKEYSDNLDLLYTKLHDFYRTRDVGHFQILQNTEEIWKC